jgi:membrane protein implicated in regulation of membrane protease activity
VGFLFSLLSFIAGGLNMHGHWPHVHGLHFNSGAGHAPAAHGPTGTDSTLQAGRTDASVSPFNFFTIAVFLAWFGGTGYLLTRYSTIVFALGLVISSAVGLVGATIVFTFLAKVLMSPEALMDPADYEMVGVLGRLCVSIRDGGTGELVYSQAGTRRVCGARSEDGTAIPKGTEVVVTRYEKGIAYVRLWSEMSGDQ